MFLTNEADYAVRVVRELSRGVRETVQTICKREMIPTQYAYKILKKMEKAGLVKGWRGANGGYSLAKDCSAITLLDVFSAVDGEPVLTDCLGHGASCPLNSGKRQCSVHRELRRLQKMLEAGLREKSLAEILEL
jgi:Rrf2 family protein